ncbi:acetate kinase [Macrococcoides bohemicum]|uniref:acetate kinase n=1 Tax=Macrococcoides bohemicum TaxID=1903056 RepID=UPI000BB59745|nr:MULTISPECIES: acetate kinase [Macrococcus]ATD30009.1 acetate kinase [Macrococcus sp. IME1552]QRN50291.1 acetate kinase [Macrococcus bohemicus]QYA44138.1 acetate kinase [Macrococcus bohemicus]
MKKIMAINAGSSSLKFQLFEMPSEKVLTKGLVERIGLKNSVFTLTVDGEKRTRTLDIKDHEEAVDMMLARMIHYGIIKSVDELDGTGHRVVQGGDLFPTSALVNRDVEEKIAKLIELAPLHNAANLMGIQAFRRMLPDIPHVAVFDTSFHSTMPETAFLYSLPYQYYKAHKVRKYGAHGTSHKYVAQRAAEMMDRNHEEGLKIISCHIGNGGSITAVKDGKSVDTSMGFTPLAGITMGTRTGDIDVATIPYLMEKLHKSAEELLNVYNKESGVLGITGISSDMRDIEIAAENNEGRAQLALDIYVDRIQKYIGQYAAVMGGVDGILFTAGVGENSDTIRAAVCEKLEFLGVKVDPEKNNGLRGKEAIISTDDSRVTVMVIPTDEEVMIARDVMEFGDLG